MRIGIVCVVPHDRFHVKENAVDFVIILIAIFPVAIDIADSAHFIRRVVVARELRDRGNLIPFASISAIRHNKRIVNPVRCHPRPFGMLRAGSGGDLLLGKASGFNVGRSAF